jgi:ribosomal protein S18 acetylase RimI-like enzyme
MLDGRADDLAHDMLAALEPRQRDRLVAAMAEVERLLVASSVDIDVCPPRHPHARAALRAYYAELAERFEDGFDPGRGIPATAADLTPPAGLLLVATLHGEPVGCGALLFPAASAPQASREVHDDSPAHIKRMWVAPAVRGMGLGGRLLGELERHAVERGVSTVRLETHHALTEAIAMYRARGYREVPAFNDELYAHHWFEKSLSSIDRNQPPGPAVNAARHRRRGR